MSALPPEGQHSAAQNVMSAKCRYRTFMELPDSEPVDGGATVKYVESRHEGLPDISRSATDVVSNGHGSIDVPAIGDCTAGMTICSERFAERRIGTASRGVYVAPPTCKAS